MFGKVLRGLGLLQDLNSIYKMFNGNQFEPYIKFIEFSSFKNFDEKSRITFNHPITVLVGGNGTNKSSILKALESCCPDKIISNRWFSTDVDAISHDPVPQFWYAHDIRKAGEIQEAQILISKYKREGNPDYWEKSKPLVGIGMSRIPDDAEFKKKWGIKSRWPQIEKEVLYLTFRETVSAFDKFFYYGDAFQKFNQISSRKSHIRKYSKYLQKVIQQNLQEYTFRNKEKVIANYEIGSDELKSISNILDVEYSKIQIVEHTFFHCSGITCKITKNKVEYSEAFAGSGEFAIIKIVHEILRAKDKSLILLDEPEVSLHPGAQERFMNFIIEQTKLKKLQFVIATHSPILIKNLPKESIKTLSLNKATNQVMINNLGCSPEEAFFHIGFSTDNKIRFIVEDRLAKLMVQHSVQNLTPAQKSLFEIEHYNGGAFDILNNFAVVYALEENKKVFIYLDGDQKRVSLPKVSDLTESQILGLESTFKDFCGGTLQIPRDSNMTTAVKKEMNLKILNWLNNQVIFLPTSGNPESIIWEKLNSEYKKDIEQKSNDVKNHFKELSIMMTPTSLDITSDVIFTIQAQYLSQIPQNDEVLLEIYNTISSKLTV